ncbi:MAG: site-specific integrase, partial [Armatimonadota bacterium]
MNRGRARAAAVAGSSPRSGGHPQSGSGADRDTEAFLDALEAEQNASVHTRAAYRRDLDDFRRFLRHEGIAAWEGVTTALARRYLAALHRRYARASIARRLAALRSFYRFLRREGRVGSSPLRVISAPRRPRRLPQALTHEAVAALLAAPPGAGEGPLRDRAILEVLYAGGMRVGELVGLTLGAVR